MRTGGCVLYSGNPNPLDLASGLQIRRIHSLSLLLRAVTSEGTSCVPSVCDDVLSPQPPSGTQVSLTGSKSLLMPRSRRL